MLTIYHAPQSRSSRVLWLLEELNADYTIRYTSIPRPDGSGGADAANPHPDKKVPALDHDGELVTESAAIFLYLTDMHKKAQMAPMPGEPRRGRYLTWLAYYAGVMEPVVHFQFFGLADHPQLQRTFRGKAEMDARINAALAAGPYFLGERFSALDVLMTSLGQFMRQALPAGEAVDAYLRRCSERPALARAQAKDAPPAR